MRFSKKEDPVDPVGYFVLLKVNKNDQRPSYIIGIVFKGVSGLYAGNQFKTMLILFLFYHRIGRDTFNQDLGGFLTPTKKIFLKGFTPFLSVILIS